MRKPVLQTRLLLSLSDISSKTSTGDPFEREPGAGLS